MKPKFNNNYQGLKCRVYLVMENKAAKPLEFNGPDDIYRLVKDEMVTSDREMLLSILLNGSNKLIGVETVSIGCLNYCNMSPREIFKSAILANAAALVVCHNHPSGSLNPSPQDIEMTKRLVEVGKMLEIHVHDHLIISHEGYRSIIEQATII